MANVPEITRVLSYLSVVYLFFSVHDKADQQFRIGDSMFMWEPLPDNQVSQNDKACLLALNPEVRVLEITPVMYANNIHPIENRAGSSNSKEKQLSKKDVVRNMLEEARMIIPGVQALFGFQLIAVFNRPFYDLHMSEQIVHLVAMVLSTVAICFLMAPAAYHRLAEREAVSEKFIEYSSKLICAGMVPLAASIALDIFVIFMLVIKSYLVAGLVAFSVFSLLTVFWYLIPVLAEIRKRPIAEIT